MNVSTESYLRHGPRFSLEDFQRVSTRATKKLKGSKKAMKMAMNAVRRQRQDASIGRRDPLETGVKFRMNALRSNRARAAAAAREAASIARDKATRQSLIVAARAARSLGYEVKSSKGRDGKISSYYARKGKVFIRISDHDIPATAARDFMAQTRGKAGYDGFEGREIIVDEPRRYEWLRRAIILTAAGRM